jgi:hypothetical protein
MDIPTALFAVLITLALMYFKADTKLLLYICTKDFTVPERENISTFVSRNTQHIGKGFK